MDKLDELSEKAQQESRVHDILHFVVDKLESTRAVTFKILPWEKKPEGAANALNVGMFHADKCVRRGSGKDGIVARVRQGTWDLGENMLVCAATGGVCLDRVIYDVYVRDCDVTVAAFMVRSRIGTCMSPLAGAIATTPDGDNMSVTYTMSSSKRQHCVMYTCARTTYEEFAAPFGDPRLVFLAKKIMGCSAQAVDTCRRNYKLGDMRRVTLKSVCIALGIKRVNAKLPVVNPVKWVVKRARVDQCDDRRDVEREMDNSNEPHHTEQQGGAVSQPRHADHVDEEERAAANGQHTSKPAQVQELDEPTLEVAHCVSQAETGLQVSSADGDGQGHANAVSDAEFENLGGVSDADSRCWNVCPGSFCIEKFTIDGKEVDVRSAVNLGIKGTISYETPTVFVGRVSTQDVDKYKTFGGLLHPNWMYESLIVPGHCVCTSLNPFVAIGKKDTKHIVHNTVSPIISLHGRSREEASSIVSLAKSFCDTFDVVKIEGADARSLLVHKPVVCEDVARPSLLCICEFVDSVQLHEFESKYDSRHLSTKLYAHSGYSVNPLYVNSCMRTVDVATRFNGETYRDIPASVKALIREGRAAMCVMRDAVVKRVHEKPLLCVEMIITWQTFMMIQILHTSETFKHMDVVQRLYGVLQPAAQRHTLEVLMPLFSIGKLTRADLFNAVRTTSPSVMRGTYHKTFSIDDWARRGADVYADIEKLMKLFTFAVTLDIDGTEMFCICNGSRMYKYKLQMFIYKDMTHIRMQCAVGDEDVRLVEQDVVDKCAEYQQSRVTLVKVRCSIDYALAMMAVGNEQLQQVVGAELKSVVHNSFVQLDERSSLELRRVRHDKMLSGRDCDDACQPIV